MNIRFLSAVLASVLLTCALSACQSKDADDDAHTTTAAPTSAATPAPAASASAHNNDDEDHDDAAATPTAIPATADAVWQAIDAKSAELKATIASGSLENVHHQAFAIRDLVAALPAQSPGLDADAQAKLQQQVKFVATLAERLDASGDAGDRAACQASYDQLVTVLNGIARTK